MRLWASATHAPSWASAMHAPSWASATQAPSWASATQARVSTPIMLVRRDPAWQRDSISLLFYCGLEDLLRAASTGPKAELGLDLLQLNAQLTCSFIIAFVWVGVALLTGVLGERRYDRPRVLATWVIAAPAAAALRLLTFDSSLDPRWLDQAALGAPSSILTDAIATLLIMNGLRLAEEQGLL